MKKAMKMTGEVVFWIVDTELKYFIAIVGLVLWACLR